MVKGVSDTPKTNNDKDEADREKKSVIVRSTINRWKVGRQRLHGHSGLRRCSNTSVLWRDILDNGWRVVKSEKWRAAGGSGEKGGGGGGKFFRGPGLNLWGRRNP